MHLLYKNEYESYFGWDISELDSPDSELINERLQPFFWRTNKNDLQIPEADNDFIIEVYPYEKLQEIARTIYEVEDNILTRYIRLIQASTNPALLTEKFDFEDMGLLSEEIDFSLEETLNKEERTITKKRLYLDLGVEDIMTPKFRKAIELIKKLISENKKVIVWCMFVGTMKKLHAELIKNEILANLIYGDTPKEIRVDLINEFRDGNTQVLISNPATLGESISLHQTVHDAIYLEYNFNLTFMLQSRDRIHRLGLKPGQYTRYYYIRTAGNSAHRGFIDQQVYDRLKEKESVMLEAIDGELLVPFIEDDYLEEVKRILK